LDYDLYAQAEAVGGFSAFLGLSEGGEDLAFPKAIGATLMMGMLSLFVLSRLGGALIAESQRRQKKKRGIAEILARAGRLARRRGWLIPQGLTPLEGAQWLRTEAGYCAAPMVDLAWFYYRIHYGPEDEGALLSSAKDALLALRADLPQALPPIDEVENGRYR
jgi:hypothetical protein